MTTESPKFKKLVAKLRELFELDKADLDFGIYRVLRARRDEIDRFLREELLPQVQKELGVVTEEKAKQFETKVEDEIQLVMNYGGKSREEAEQAEPVKKAKALLEQARNPAAIEDEVYSLLTTFFGRYYEGGDFISLRRYSGPGKERYMLPYNGEEVKLVWANMDQYYIKSAENFRDYAFRIPPLEADQPVPEPDLRRCVRFKLVEASSEKDNMKTANGKRLFALADLEEHPLAVSVQDGVETLEIPFTYALHGKEAKQVTLLQEAFTKVMEHADLTSEFKAGLSILAPTETRPERTILEKHLETYAAKNSFDYFIHKNLGGFLTRELDYFLKSDVLRVDDLLTEDEGTRALTLKKAKAFKLVAEKIVMFLHRLEQFQKKLWLKKKFVVETRYCVTLDRVPEELYPEICACEEQWKEWEELIGITVKPEKRTVEVLKENPYLMLDTGHFNSEFGNRLLAAMTDLEANTNGVCFQSDNFQALTFMQGRYREEVKCIYIDPPYNTEQDRNEGKFIYKDSFPSSSWCSLMYDRLVEASNLMASDGLFFSSIDHNEIASIKAICESVYLKENFEGLISWRRRHNQPNDKTKMIGMVSEYIVTYAKSSPELKRSGVGKLDLTGDFSNPDNDPLGDWASKPWKVGSDQSGSRYTITTPSGKVLDEEWMGDEESYSRLLADGRIYFPNSGNGMPRKKYYRSEREQEGQCATNWWEHSQFGHNQGANDTLTALFQQKNIFSNPKPVELIRGVLLLANTKNSVVCDFFAGSGTLAHASIVLNREDNGCRQYIVCEMGEHFDSVISPRIKKVAYSPDWKEGKPTTRDKGISHAFKIIKLESYEDCLNNLILNRTEAQQELLEANPSVREDYLLGYFLDVETKDSVLQLDRFTNPWAYQLNIATGNVGESKPTNVDLVETFNWLLGMQVEHISIIEHLRPDKGFKEDDHGRMQLASPRLRSAKPEENEDCRSFQTVEGTLRTGEKTLIIWRTLTQPAKNQDAARALEEDNVMLEEFLYRKAINPREKQWDLIFVNGDHTLDNLAERLSLDAKSPEEAVHFKVRTIEPEFQRLMFEGTED